MIKQLLSSSAMSAIFGFIEKECGAALVFTVSSGGSIAITKQTAATIVAPAAVWLEATGASGFTLSTPPAGTDYEPSVHEITYIWTLRGNPLSDWTAPENMLAEWNNPNIAYGQDVAFCLTDPGTYNIDLWCIDRNGVTAVATTSVVVQDADDVYPGTQTIVCDPDGDFTGAPVGAQTSSSVANLQSKIDSINDGTPHRVLFRRGKTFDWSNIRTTDSDNANYFGAWGTGAKPVFTGSTSFNTFWLFGGSSATIYPTFTNLRFEYPWESDKELGQVGTRDPVQLLDCEATIYGIVYGLEITGLNAWNLALGGNLSTKASRFLVADTFITNWRNFGIFYYQRAETKFGVLGCRIQQNVDALNGGDKFNVSNAHGPIRVEASEVLYVAQNDLFSRTGWSSLSPDRADQPCLRVFTGQENGSTTMRANVNRNVMEGGFRQMILEADDNNGENPGNNVIDSNLFLATSKSCRAFIRCNFGGTTIRNNIGIYPNVPAYHGTTDPLDNGVSYSFNGTLGTQNRDTPQALYSNTFIALRTQTGTWGAQEFITIFTTNTVENNVTYAPNFGTPNTADAPIDVATAFSGITPRYRGVRYNFGPIFHTNSVSIANGASSDTIPYPSGTDQAYWLANGESRHIIDHDNNWYAEDGDFTVTYNAGGFVITNTSGSTWGTNQMVIRLDRLAQIPPMQYEYANPTHTLAYDGQSSNFTVGSLLTGGTSGAKAGIISDSDSGATGTLTIHLLSGTFLNDEIITDADGGSATVNGTATAVVTFPLPRLLAGSAALDDATTGLVAYNDFFTNVRPATANRGALEDA